MQRSVMRTAVVLSFTLSLVGCALNPTASSTPETGMSIHGSVYGGQQPNAGAHIYLFAANTTGYGQPSVSLLNNSGGLVELSSSGSTIRSVFDASMGEATGVAIDPTGNIWTVSNATGSAVEISSTGTILSGVSGFYNSGVGGGDVGNLAIAPNGNVWIASLNGLFEFTNAGVSQNPHGGFSGGGLSASGPRLIVPVADRAHTEFLPNS